MYTKPHFLYFGKQIIKDNFYQIKAYVNLTLIVKCYLANCSQIKMEKLFVEI